MLYERFFKWITFYKRRHCIHDFKKVSESREYKNYDIYYYQNLECTSCGKKKKILDPEKNGI